MFFVSGTKIYLSTYDAELKAYPECKLVRREDDTVCVVKAGGGIAKKPKHRRVCTLAELIAQFGAAAVAEVKAGETNGSDEGKDKGKE